MKLPTLEELKHVHIIAIGGTLMGAFAAFLKRRGIEVTGSDGPIYPPMSDVLARAGVKPFTGYSADNLRNFKRRPDLVIIGNAISANNVEAREALDQGYVYTSLPEAMEKILLPQTRNIVVAGTHGKTTTSSILAFVLHHSGKKPNYFIGGVSTDLPDSFHIEETSANHPFVLEGDEYDTAFWDKVPKFNHYLPNDTILTSIEYDHADIYPDMAAVVKAFSGLLARARPNGRLIACVDYPSVSALLKEAKVPVITYGSESSNGRFKPGKIETRGDHTHFEVLDQGRKVAELAIRLPGHHNVLNAIAVWIECRELGLQDFEIAKGLRAFQGVKRRQEVRGEPRGITVIDDFAHHPTAVRETLRALRLKYPGRRLIAVFEPRSATSRRKVFQKEYADAFLSCDVSRIAMPFDQSKIAAADQFSSDQLVSDIRLKGGDSGLFGAVEEGVQTVAGLAKTGDVIAVLSNGGFGGFIPKLIETLQK